MKIKYGVYRERDRNIYRERQIEREGKREISIVVVHINKCCLPLSKYPVVIPRKAWLILVPVLI